jgi:hypothetical protein
VCVLVVCALCLVMRNCRMCISHLFHLCTSIGKLYLFDVLCLICVSKLLLISSPYPLTTSSHHALHSSIDVLLQQGGKWQIGTAAG